VKILRMSYDSTSKINTIKINKLLFWGRMKKLSSTASSGCGHLYVVTHLHARILGQYYQNIQSDSTIMSLISWFALFSVLSICISQIVFSIDGQMASLQVYKARVSLLTSVDEQCIPRLWIINLTLHILCIISSS